MGELLCKSRLNREIFCQSLVDFSITFFNRPIKKIKQYLVKIIINSENRAMNVSTKNYQLLQGEF
jgi:hypothetical protein